MLACRPPESVLKQEVERLRTLLSDASSPLPVEWRLTNGETTVFQTLLAHDVASLPIILEVTRTTAATVRVLIGRIRSKLAPRGVQIETLLGKGWRLVSREQWRAIVAATQEGAQ